MTATVPGTPETTTSHTSQPPTSSTLYYCPGESQPISEAVHWGRLKNFDERCRECPHRTSLGPLAKSIARQLQQAWDRSETLTFADEGVSGLYLNELGPSQAALLAAAFGQLIHSKSPGTTSVAVVADGRPLSAELLASVVSPLRQCGLNVVDLGAATVGLVQHAIDQPGLHGALLLGNATSRKHHVTMRLWTAGGAPAAFPDEIQQLQSAYHASARPVRRECLGSYQRRNLTADYLRPLALQFHALRPLKVVIDSGSRPLKNYLGRLSATVGCQFVDLRETSVDPSVSLHADRERNGQVDAETDQRLRALARAVVAQRAHFGFWTDGDGETSQLIDEQGRWVPPQLLMLLMATQLVNVAQASIVLPMGMVTRHLSGRLQTLGLSIIESEPNRHALWQEMQSPHAALASDGQGRYWFGRSWTGGAPMCDALRTLTELLVILSQGDAELSAAIAA